MDCALARVSFSLSLLFMTGFSTLSLGAGVSLREQSIRSASMAMAADGVGVGDAASLYANPASIGNLSGQHISLGLRSVSSSAEWKGTGAGSTVETSQSAKSKNGMLPSLHGVHAINDKVNVGWGVAPTFGASVEYEDNWMGRYYSEEIALSNLVLDVVGSYKVSDNLVVGGGVYYSQSSFTLATAVDIGRLTQAAGGTPFAQDSSMTFEGDSAGAGYSLGALYKPMDNLTVGLGFRSALVNEYEGSVTYKDSSAQAAAFRSTASATNATLAASSDATVRTVQPQIATLGISYDLDVGSSLFVNINQTKWSSNGRLDVKYNNGFTGEEIDYEDTLSYSIGGQYQLDEAITLRGGVGIDPEVATTAASKGVRGVDGNRTIVALGGGYKVSDYTFDFGYSMYMIDEVKVARAESLTKSALNAKGNSTLSFFMLGGSMTL